MGAATLAAEIDRATVPAQRARKEKMKPLLVNLGGPTIEDPGTKERWVSGREFKGAEWGYKGGSPRKINSNKNETPSPSLSAIEGIESFHRKVENGSYEVTLYFCDRWAGGPVFFFVKGEGKRFVRGAIELQKDTPSQRRGVVKVTDGQLDIVFDKKKGEPILNAIRIVPK